MPTSNVGQNPPTSNVGNDTSATTAGRVGLTLPAFCGIILGRSLNSRITGKARFSRKTKDAEDVMRMLIVEDQEKHLADAKATVKKLQQKFELEVRYAETLEEAKSLLDWAEVVVTDLFFPEKAGESPDPSEPPPKPFNKSSFLHYAEEHLMGVRLANLALDQKKPFVICTSTNHHGTKTGPANIWIRERCLELVDNIDGRTEGGEAPNKRWSFALYEAIALMETRQNFPDLYEQFWQHQQGKEFSPDAQEFLRKMYLRSDEIAKV